MPQIDPVIDMLTKIAYDLQIVAANAWPAPEPFGQEQEPPPFPGWWTW
jgi:hypothetical protein